MVDGGEQSAFGVVGGHLGGAATVISGTEATAAISCHAEACHFVLVHLMVARIVQRIFTLVLTLAKPFRTIDLAQSS